MSGGVENEEEIGLAEVKGNSLAIQPLKALNLIFHVYRIAKLFALHCGSVEGYRRICSSSFAFFFRRGRGLERAKRKRKIEKHRKEGEKEKMIISLQFARKLKISCAEAFDPDGEAKKCFRTIKYWKAKPESLSSTAPDLSRVEKKCWNEGSEIIRKYIELNYWRIPLSSRFDRLSLPLEFPCWFGAAAEVSLGDVRWKVFWESSQVIASAGFLTSPHIPQTHLLTSTASKFAFEFVIKNELLSGSSHLLSIFALDDKTLKHPPTSSPELNNPLRFFQCFSSRIFNIFPSSPFLSRSSNNDWKISPRRRLFPSFLPLALVGNRFQFPTTQKFPPSLTLKRAKAKEENRYALERSKMFFEWKLFPSFFGCHKGKGYRKHNFQFNKKARSMLGEDFFVDFERERMKGEKRLQDCRQQIAAVRLSLPRH